MPVNDELGKRMKENYEQIPKYKLMRRSVQMVGQANFSHTELHGKSCNMIQDMLHEQKGLNWNDYPTRWKRGVCWTKEKGLDYDMPMLKGEGRKSLEDLVHYVEEE